MELVRCEKYYDLVQQRWPELSHKQIDKIVKHGLLNLYMYNLYGADILLKTNDYTMYFGKLFKSDLVFYKYWLIKWKIKLRMKYLKAKTKYDGYYYFGLTESEWEKYKEQKKHRRTKMHFDQLMLFKIREECELHHQLKYIFRVPFPEDCGFRMYKKDWTTKGVEYIAKRNKDNTIEPISYEQKSSNKYIQRRFK